MEGRVGKGLCSKLIYINNYYIVEGATDGGSERAKMPKYSLGSNCGNLI
jgi:hypothetical protein